MAKNKHYEIRTLDGDKVETRSEKPAAVKRADKLAEETGTAYQVFTYAGTLVHETAAPQTEELTESVAAEVADLDNEEETFTQIVPFHELLADMRNEFAPRAEPAAAEWERRMEIYRQASRAKDPAKRIVGPKMAAALELGGLDDSRTTSALVRRGLATFGESRYELKVNEAGRAALEAARLAVG